MRQRFFTATPLPFFLILCAVVSGTAGYHFQTFIPPVLMMLIGASLGAGAAWLFYVLFRLLGKLVNKLPLKFNAAVLGTIAALVLVKFTAFRWPDLVFYPAALLTILFSMLLYFSVKQVTLSPKSSWAWLGIAVTLVFLAGSFFWLQQEGRDPFTENLPPLFSSTNVATLSSQGLVDPTTPGNYEVITFTYGSGHDQQRQEYAEGVVYQTQTVDASRLLPDWKGKKKKWRERYWGFGVANFPLNGRVYMPEGTGPFPVILVVHGNHSMLDYSDDGYGYLGELLASRGFITVSVDENFINGHWSGDFRGKEMPVRGWLLLKHLEQWRSWNQTTTHPLAGKADLNKVLLMGHSRGGEAVSIAAAFNQLPRFPDDAQEVFDFNFGIKGIVTLAPTDYRYNRQITLKDISYLSLQGSYDSDEVSFWGMRPYRRLIFSLDSKAFKAGVYLHRANHGQFNTTWGRTDFGGTMAWLLNTAPLLSGKEQQQATQVFITAFAEATLHQNQQYLPLFKNIAAARDWLPDNYYLTHFQSAQTDILVDFEEDINLTTAGNKGVIQAKNLTTWREENLGTRDQGSQENNVVILGWNYGEDINADSLASFKVVFSDSVDVDSLGSMVITLASGNPQWLNQKESQQPDEEAREELPPDATIKLTDRNGHSAQLRISDTKPIAPRLKTRFTKLALLDREMIGTEWEVQPETFYFPLESFQTDSSAFDVQQLRAISLVFDQNTSGVLVVDDIGFSRQP
ncbi:hypothetical protein [Tunicatimonas pelagia]|uniref:hypothetical protein n=1 Tax=Tunicatimonas pelagia TaxID=931531 RepID=UPI002664E574|nr:hypothetical protein [Tunicatimonas pelagia]WKN43493.1 hypothetical protein P0M28_00735 [Tunicatimonas pelagia]